MADTILKNGYRLSRSNYVLDEKHRRVSGGTIYHKDYMATTNLGRFDSDYFAYENSNFKFVRGNRSDNGRVSSYGDWKEWQENELRDETNKVLNEIELKPNNNSLLDFVYFGSCVELVKTTVNRVIAHFPAYAYSTGKNLIYHDNVQGIAKPLIGESWFEFKNPYGIDFFTSGRTAEAMENPKRFFCMGRDHFRINGSSIGDDWSQENGTHCENGVIYSLVTIKGIKFLICSYQGKMDILTDSPNVKITTVDEEYDEYYKTCTDVERLLLPRINKGSKKKYVVQLDVYRDTEDGMKMHREKLVWPTLNDGITPDVTSQGFLQYMSKLIDISMFYDSYCTDNMWRNMVHDPIKVMDSKFIDDREGEEDSDYEFAIGRMHGFIKACARQFDEVKRYIDNIRNAQTVTYNENNNVPDYFLSDQLELSGWEVSPIIPEGSGNTVYSGYTFNDAYRIFLRNLKINSPYILRKKGTKDGIRSILGMFGLSEFVDYTFREYVHNAISTATYGEVVSINESRLSYNSEIDEPLQGLPILEKDGKIYPYLYKDMQDENLYFQMYGSWVEETSKYVGVVYSVNSLYNFDRSKLHRGDIFRVNGENGYYYMVLKDVDESFNNEGWEEVRSNHPAYAKCEKAASLVESLVGNNPHIGYQNRIGEADACKPIVRYDDGQHYYHELANPFERYRIAGELCEYKDVFNITSVISTTGKTEYFHDIDKNTNISGYDREESRMLSKLNDKNLMITFTDKVDAVFVQTYIKPYLLQMVPSTTIIKIETK